MTVSKKTGAESNPYINRINDALFTPRIKGLKLQKASMDWLRSKGHVLKQASAEEATKAILSCMITEQKFSKHLCQMLKEWDIWVRGGAMGVKDFCSINEKKASFAQASLVIVALSGLENEPAAALSIMQECAANWEYVELG